MNKDNTGEGGVNGALNTSLDTQKWFSEAGWSGNPFTLNIIPEIFVGFPRQKSEIESHLKLGHKFALVMGPPGTGKTNLLKHMEKAFSRDFHVIYFPKPPPGSELLDVFLKEFQPPFLDRLLRKKHGLSGLHEHIRKTMKRKVLVLFDEAHEAETEVLMWIRTWTDQIEGFHVIFAGLEVFEEKLRQELETLSTRINTKVLLDALSEEETKQLIRNRIERHSGKGTEPFTDRCIEEIYQQTGGIPREILKACDTLIRKAMSEGKMIIDTMEEERDEEPQLKDMMRRLPFKQREILKILAEQEEMTPADIAEKLKGSMGMERFRKTYMTDQHAIRSMNNILNRLMEDGYVDRREWGKGFAYSLVVRVRNMFIEK